MDVLIMAGGKGTRLNLDIEKPLLQILKKPMIDYIIESLLNSKINNIYIAVSKNTQKSKCYIYNKYIDHIKNNKIKLLETEGLGYINDLNQCMKHFSEPFMVLCCDIPSITPKIINNVIDEYYRLKANFNNLESLCVVVKKEDYLGSPSVVMDEYVPQGINILSPKNGEQVEKLYIIEEPILNVNTLEEKSIVERIIKNCYNNR
ncbi:MAG TPA: adenosylcobinamide-phosphate guanylyltransferase [Methanothermococcus okinawensis]|uniref:Adenosylcobinamide-phosphate guanylyltransferase n=1 Tax=Methanothermococcus okinawensis TaxID=155863 RepID=A0A832YT43_9EURY|nr:adenosylcobinamide-phosphate guanylyltransferase [Methanothermococcus okinawensis]